jgi:hypothetical protein
MYRNFRSKATMLIQIVTASEPNKGDNMNNVRCEDSRHLRKREGISER